MNNSGNMKHSMSCRSKRFGIENRRKTQIRIACLLTACTFILYGYLRGEAGIVLNKAVNICLECIGLG